MKEAKLFLFADYECLLRKLNGIHLSTTQVSKFSKVTEYEVNVQNSTVFL